MEKVPQVAYGPPDDRNLDADKPNASKEASDASEKLAVLRKNVEIIFSAHGHEKEAQKIVSIEKRSDGLYDVKWNGDRFGKESIETAVLDLEFPFSSDDINTVLAKYAGRPDREIFFAIGPATADLPDKHEEENLAGTKRAFIISDAAFGVAMDEVNFLAYNQHGLALRDTSNSIVSSDIRNLPDESYLFSKLDLNSMPENSFDTIQAANVLNDPSAHLPLGSLTRLLKPETGELVIVATNTPLEYGLRRLLDGAKALSCEAIVVWDAESSGSTDVPLEVQEMLKKYHVIAPYGIEGSYIAILKKQKEIRLEKD